MRAIDVNAPFVQEQTTRGFRLEGCGFMQQQPLCIISSTSTSSTNATNNKNNTNTNNPPTTHQTNQTNQTHQTNQTANEERHSRTRTRMHEF